MPEQRNWAQEFGDALADDLTQGESNLGTKPPGTHAERAERRAQTQASGDEKNRQRNKSRSRDQ